MKIKEIDIHGVGCINSLHLAFNDSMNILCGPNSIGKTTIIESVASMFMYGQPTVKRNVLCDKGSIKAKIESDGSVLNSSIEVKSFTPFDTESTNSFMNLSSKIISIKVERNFAHSKLDAIPSDKSRELHELWSETRNGVTFEGVKGWFVNRYLYSAREGTLSKQQVSNYRLAERCFSIRRKIEFCTATF